MRNIVLALSCNRKGATAIEYGLIASLIAVATIAGLTNLGAKLNTKFYEIATSIANAG